MVAKPNNFEKILENRHPERKNRTGYAVNRLLKDKLTLQDMSIALKVMLHIKLHLKNIFLGCLA